MIGNDIIDRHAAARESNWKRRGWLDKLFTETERGRIFSNADPETMIWLLWSMKESAYKIWNRLSMQRRYHPHQFHCQLRYFSDREAAGTVSFGMLRMHTQTVLTADWLHTIARPENNYRGINVYTGKHGTPGAERPVYQKDAYGLPYIPGAGGESAKPASVSHHGRYEAIVY